MDFENHAWVRLNTFVDMISPRIHEMARALDDKKHIIDYRDLINKSGERPLEEYRLDNRDIQSLTEFIELLSQLSQPYANQNIISNEDRPLPKGALRARPPL